jgi:lipoprotein signal peptidase
VDRQWSGRVAHAHVGSDGTRVGVAIAWPDGPGARPEPARRDPPWSIASRDDGDDHRLGLLRGAAGRGVGDLSVSWAVPALALAGLTVDQLSKAWADSVGPGFDLVAGLLAVGPAENFGAVASLADDLPLTAPLCAAGALALAALSVSSRRVGTADALGAGVLAAGLLGNSADRLALGYVRDFLVTGLLPNWSFNLADVFLITGALTLLTARFGDQGGPADV